MTLRGFCLKIKHLFTRPSLLFITISSTNHRWLYYSDFTARTDSWHALRWMVHDDRVYYCYLKESDEWKVDTEDVQNRFQKSMAKSIVS